MGYDALEKRLRSWSRDIRLFGNADQCVREAADAIADLRAAPIDMVLYCPKCGLQHIDEPSESWDNPPHKSHLCHRCGLIWRPCDRPTNGICGTATVGKADNWNGPTETVAEVADLREALREIEAVEIDWRLSTAENMRAASDIARAALKENHDD